MIGVEDGAIMLDRIVLAKCEWQFTVYEGDVQHNDCGRVINPILRQWSQHNLITTVGKGLILDRLFGLSAAIALAGTAVGTSATAADVANTTLTGTVYKVFDSTPIRSGTTSPVVTAITTYTTAEANINIQESALQCASGGPLLNRLAPVLSFTKTTATSFEARTTITQA